MKRHSQHLARHEVVGYFAESGPAWENWRFGRDDEITEVTVSDPVAVNETLAYLALAVEGHGVIRLARPIAAPYLERGALVEILQPYRPAPVPVSVLYPTARHLSPAVRVFVDWVTTLFSQVG
ncbi:LysR substrate-binding domain-containing protein [Azospirillum oryzae]|uniref:LysR substrate-binding domain-containing protein n=1 Tax=Azospirillum oryzae TaxID=286727 RepID=UPI000A14EB85|nr:LysR substrate-binding domain-containing protein [Azospirillum oryzae]